MKKRVILTGFITRISTYRPLTVGPDYLEFASFPDGTSVDNANILSRMLLEKVHIKITIAPNKVKKINRSLI
jgi:hypothetical protein